MLFFNVCSGKSFWLVFGWSVMCKMDPNAIEMTAVLTFQPPKEWFSFSPNFPECVVSQLVNNNLPCALVCFSLLNKLS